MEYSQITVTTTSEAGELIAYFLQEVCIDGVSIYDINDLKTASWDYMDDNVEAIYAQGVLVKGYCKQQDTDKVLEYLKEQFAHLDKEQCGSLEIKVDTVSDDSWVATWKANFQPIEIGDIVVCPEWLMPTEEQSKTKRILMLDTGIAFGTGQHETTSMCIELFGKAQLKGAKVLDVGCGSGILGLSALLCGAQHATLVDIDSQATDIAVHNASINDMTDKVDIVCGNLTDKVDGKFDVVFANLTADILYMLAQDICDKVNKGSRLVLSGILTDRVDKVIKCYTDIGFILKERKDKGEWSALLMVYGNV